MYLFGNFLVKDNYSKSWLNSVHVIFVEQELLPQIQSYLWGTSQTEWNEQSAYQLILIYKYTELSVNPLLLTLSQSLS